MTAGSLKMTIEHRTVNNEHFPENCHCSLFNVQLSLEDALTPSPRVPAASGERRLL